MKTTTELSPEESDAPATRDSRTPSLSVATLRRMARKDEKPPSRRYDDCIFSNPTVGVPCLTPPTTARQNFLDRQNLGLFETQKRDPGQPRGKSNFL